MIVKDPDKFPSPVTEKWTLFVCNIGREVNNLHAQSFSGCQVVHKDSKFVQGALHGINAWHKCLVLMTQGQQATLVHEEKYR